MSLAVALYRGLNTYYRKMAEKRAHGGKQFVVELVYLGMSLAGSALLMRWVLSNLDPEKSNKQKAKELKKLVQRRLRMKTLSTNSYEDAVAMDVINPEQIDTTLDDIGGCDRIKQDLRNRVILPLKKPEFYSSRLVRQVKGVLLYGPPGTGKTMLAKALAKESGANFINVRPSMLQSKWFGETQKLVQATFSLAHKIQPCIIFVDEVDALLGSRRANEHEVTTSMKTEFMQLWDGMLTDKRTNVMVLAATNRPFDLDEAILRRFGAQFEVPMPDKKARRAILALILRHHAIETEYYSNGAASVDPALLQDLEPERQLTTLADRTEGFSGSDLYELAAEAASLPLHEFSEAAIRAEEQGGAGPSSSEERFASCEEDGSSGSGGSSPLANGWGAAVAAAAALKQARPLALGDFERALESFRPSGVHAHEYRQQQASNGQVEPGQFLQALASMLNMAMANGNGWGANGNGHRA